jgi:hypothetical protein
MIERGVNPEALAVRTPLQIRRPSDNWKTNFALQRIIKELRQEAQDVERRVAAR